MSLIFDGASKSGKMIIFRLLKENGNAIRITLTKSGHSYFKKNYPDSLDEFEQVSFFARPICILEKEKIIQVEKLKCIVGKEFQWIPKDLVFDVPIEIIQTIDIY